MASLSQGRTAAAQCGLFTYKSVPVIFEPPCTSATDISHQGDLWLYHRHLHTDMRNRNLLQGYTGLLSGLSLLLLMVIYNCIIVSQEHYVIDKEYGRSMNVKDEDTVMNLGVYTWFPHQR